MTDWVFLLDHHFLNGFFTVWRKSQRCPAANQRRCQQQDHHSRRKHLLRIGSVQQQRLCHQKSHVKDAGHHKTAGYLVDGCGTQAQQQRTRPLRQRVSNMVMSPLPMIAGKIP